MADDPDIGETDSDALRRADGRPPAHPDAEAVPRWLDAVIATAKEPPLADAEVEAALRSVMARRADDRADVALASVGRGRWRRSALRAAAAVLLVAGGSLVWRSVSQPPVSDDMRVAANAPARFASAIGRLDTLRLVDGTRVVLGPRSVLTLGAGYGRGTREVSLDGEAHFEVVHDEARPFIVRAGRATMRDVGTSFAVRGDSGMDVRVWVTEGAVDVRAAQPGDDAPVVLRAGDLATVSARGVSVMRGAVTPGDLAWMRGDLVFRDATFAQVREGIRRWYGLEIVAGDSIVAARRLTATLSRDRADAVGGVLAAALGGTVTRSADTLRIGAAARAPAR